MMIQSRFKDSGDNNSPVQALHIFAENVPVQSHDDSIFNQLAGLPIKIEAINIVPCNCGFTEGDIKAAKNHQISDTSGLVKCLKLKLEAK